MSDNRVMGTIACPYCGCAHAVAKEMRSGAVVTCPNEADGGCNSQFFGRSRTARGVIARKVTKWNDPLLRKELLGGEPVEKPLKPKAQRIVEPKPMDIPAPENSNSNNNPETPTKAPARKLLGGLLEY